MTTQLASGTTPGTVPVWSAGADPLTAVLRGEVARRVAASGAAPSGQERADRVHGFVQAVLDEHARRELADGRAALSPPKEKAIARAIADSLIGMGGLQPLLDDPTISNIFINGSVVWVTRTDGRKEQLPPVAGSSEELIELVRDIAARAGTDERRFDRGVPKVSVRLPDGSRLFATMLSREPSVSIRRHTLLRTSLQQLALDNGAMPGGMVSLFSAMVRARKNIIICGGTNSGKTTFLRALAREIPPQERLVTIEDTDELALDQDPDHPDCIALQAREANIEGEGAIDQAELVRWGLRMAPDRVILGEARGGEVIPLLNAMSQGNDGSLATIHTSSSRQAFVRLQTYAAQAAERLPFEATAPLIAGAVHFVVHLDWAPDRKRVVSSVREVLHHEGADVISNELFRPGFDRRAQPATPLRSDTLDQLTAAGFRPELIEGW
ncbi:ATPase, T2SS/T4P/T4SS family [Longispora sp. K20-0274]|uniref:CpaF family protein n=1 Tax=Longispora sp. K20-0274 TaxID=3088255 RepID=UPI00399A6A04